MSTIRPYVVLARKYRPKTFVDLKGQEVLVRTLTNAFAMSRVAHAMLLTGIRGIGKTTTARIIARSLNCIGPDGTSGPTINPCGVCEPCVSILEGRNTDVIEMDAASRTGVNDIREVIENCYYLPSSTRYKIYIIDEVHMLSQSAFNALLKTLEEPPAHVKFIFATTENRKIPVTIISRCQRFDLRRLSEEEMVSHLTSIATLESYQIEPLAATLLAKAAEGSVRDGLSLLDQAIALTSTQEGITRITEVMVKSMLGTADGRQLLGLFTALTEGKVHEALIEAESLYRAGLDPVLMLNDLLELCYVLTQAKVAGASACQASPSMLDDVVTLSSTLSMTFLTRSWQMLLKGLGEVQTAPQAKRAADMVLVRLAYSATLPSPIQLVESWEESQKDTNHQLSSLSTLPAPKPINQSIRQPKEDPTPQEKSPPEFYQIHDFNALVSLFKAHDELVLYHVLHQEARLVSFADGELTLSRVPALTAEVLHRVRHLLKDWTGKHWNVMVVDVPGNASMHEAKEIKEEEAKQQVLARPEVQQVLELFPGAQVKHIIKETEEA